MEGDRQLQFSLIDGVRGPLGQLLQGASKFSRTALNADFPLGLHSVSNPCCYVTDIMICLHGSL